MGLAGRVPLDQHRTQLRSAGKEKWGMVWIAEPLTAKDAKKSRKGREEEPRRTRIAEPLAAKDAKKSREGRKATLISFALFAALLRVLRG